MTSRRPGPLPRREGASPSWAWPPTGSRTSTWPRSTGRRGPPAHRRLLRQARPGLGADGIYYASDATDHGRFNLFRMNPVTGEAPGSPPRPPRTVTRARSRTARCSTRPTRAASPTCTSCTTGRRSGSPTSPPASTRRAHAKGRGALASTFFGGRFRLVEVSKVALLDERAGRGRAADGRVASHPDRRVPGRRHRVRPAGARNWRPENGIVYGGGGGGAVAGRAAVLFSDMLRDHVLFVDVSVLGCFDYTEAIVLYEDRSRRTGVLGAFHYVQQQIDSLNLNLAYIQRDFGVVGALRYPLDRYQRFEVELIGGGVAALLPDRFHRRGDPALRRPRQPGSAYASTADWNRRNGGDHPHPLADDPLRLRHGPLRLRDRTDRWLLAPVRARRGLVARPQRRPRLRAARRAAVLPDRGAGEDRVRGSAGSSFSPNGRRSPGSGPGG